MKKRIILCNEVPAYFEPIKDRVEHSDLIVEVVYARSHEEALSLTPNKDQCLIITDSVVPGEGVKNATDGALILLKNVKDKNKNCVVVLYAMEILPIDVVKFDIFINSCEENSFNLLFKKIVFFCKN